MQKATGQTLSQIENRIVRLVVQGYRNREIARKLSLSEWILSKHLKNIYNALGVSDRLELILYWIVHGIAA